MERKQGKLSSADLIRFARYAEMHGDDAQVDLGLSRTDGERQINHRRMEGYRNAAKRFRSRATQTARERR